MDIEKSDTMFDLVFGRGMHDVARVHYTPIEIVKFASEFLADEPGKKVLDVGSGAGKFCMVGSVHTKGHFTGVELRPHLHDSAVELSKRFELENVDFIQANIMEIDFKDYEAFYVFNPFYENIIISGIIDDSIELNKDNYELYNIYVKKQLESMPIGTKLVTYFSYSKEIPDNYKLLFALFDDKLKFWKKVND